MRYYGKLPIVLLSEMAAGKGDSRNCRMAAYLLAHPEQAPILTVDLLAETCFVSKSSVSRFCREIGLDDFCELKDLLQTDGRNFTLCGGELSVQAQATLFSQLVQESLALVVESLDYVALEKLVKEISAAREVAVFGLLKAETAAMNLQNDLVMLQKNAVTKVSFREQIDYLSAVPEGALVLVFSYTGIYFDYGLPQVRLRKGAAPLWLVTGNPSAVASVPNAQILSFASKLDFPSHPYQLQLVASLIAQRYARTLG